MTYRIRTEIDPRYSAPGVSAPGWEGIAQLLTNADVYALTTVLPDGTPHTVPVAGAWNDFGFWFCTGEYEQKARNMAQNPRASLYVGSHQFLSGMDVVVRGNVVQATEEPRLRMLAEAINAKYPEPFRFSVTEGALLNPHGNRADVYCIQPEVAHVFTRGENTVQARYTFEDESL